MPTTKPSPFSTATPDPPAPVPACPSGGAVVFVVLVWVVQVVAGVLVAKSYGNRTIPVSDEWSLLVTAPESVRLSSLSWLWEQYVEHRVPLAKLLWLGTLRLTDYDFQRGLYFSVAALAGLALVLLVAARLLRGRTSYWDAFFPLTILSLGQGYNFTWWWQVNHLLAPLVVMTLLAVIVVYGTRLRPSHAVLTAFGLMLLTLCGPAGLPYVLTLAVWLGYWAVMHWRTGGRAALPASLRVLILTALAVVLVGCYFIDFKPTTTVSSSPNALASWNTSVQILASGLGMAARPHWHLLGYAAFALVAVSMVVLVAVCCWRPEERCRALGLLLFQLAAVGLLVVMGRSRASLGEGYIFGGGTYMLHAASALCGVYFTFEIYLTPRLGPLVQACFFTAACLLLSENVTLCLKLGANSRKYEDAVEADLQAGVPGFILAERYVAADLGRPDRIDLVSPLLDMLRQRRAGVFKFLRKDPDFREVPLPVEPVAVHQTTWKDGAAHGTAGVAVGASLTFAWEHPRHVYALRVKCIYEDTATAQALFRLYWRLSSSGDFTDQDPANPQGKYETTLSLNPGGTVQKIVEGKLATVPQNQEIEVTIWINENIDQVRIYPEVKACVFKPTALTLLVRPDEQK